MPTVFMRLPRAIKVFIVAIVYFGLGVVSLSLSFGSSNATPVWPPSGFAFAMLLLWGRSIAPGIFLGAYAANLYIFLSGGHISLLSSGIASLIIGMGNTLEGLTGSYLMEQYLFPPKRNRLFSEVRSVLFFVTIVLGVCLISSMTGVVTTYLSGAIAIKDSFFTLFTWWIGDVSGILILTPFLFVLLKQKKVQITTAKIYETIVLLTCIVIISGVVFLNWFHPRFLLTRAFMVTPFLILVSVRLHLPVLTFINLVASSFAISGSLSGIGPFIAPTLNESLITAAVFASVNAIVVLLLHAAIQEQREKERSLQAARNNLEEQVRIRTKELEQKNRELEMRNSELASFSYAASHDLQEPLRKIQTFSDLIVKTEHNLSDKGKSLFSRIQYGAERMKQLIENILAFSRVEGTTMFTDTDLNEVLEKAKQDLDEKIETAAAVIRSDKLPTVHVVPFQLEQLFTNLLSNSLKFRKKDTPLHITIRYKKTAVPDAAGGEQNEKKYHRISFIDNGIGFDPEYAGKIFEMFQRLHGQTEYEGTGIGLAICKKIAEHHGGFMEAESRPCEGASFHIYLPVDKEGND